MYADHFPAFVESKVHVGDAYSVSDGKLPAGRLSLDFDNNVVLVSFVLRIYFESERLVSASRFDKQTTDERDQREQGVESVV